MPGQTQNLGSYDCCGGFISPTACPAVDGGGGNPGLPSTETLPARYVSETGLQYQPSGDCLSPAIVTACSASDYAQTTARAFYSEVEGASVDSGYVNTHNSRIIRGVASGTGKIDVAVAHSNDNISSNRSARGRVEREARKRAIALNVGFDAADPYVDLMSAPMKQKCYVQCLEEYVIWIHDQLRAFGVEVPEFKRVDGRNALTDRSAKMLLVHMQNTARYLYDRTKEKEEEYVRLQQLRLQDH
ncbi:hypothetical protein GALMADRAFT_207967 [Galerina marginata CBS 339.88]|uniref:Uncharacterized protein n=1 Tax=Galerina marginata (strain CBS 339.88) TaxID=685588 RepID=A0A067TD89_GALM3|nr:hypothetical protein GALMADRAFT_207967 [Galerina marginata CBS 339.88]